MAADSELNRIKKQLQENERLMQEAAVKYEDLVAAKESLRADLEAHKLARKKAQETSGKSTKPRSTLQRP
ncbi:MAG TPA: hypothetical protein VG938_02285 [Verrucomicrobiae bacterium]|jgi:hypothetical protein|nr:hypothetical protein [Verrucomicrobiae bacterium]